MWRILHFFVFQEDPAKPVVPRPVDHASNEEQVETKVSKVERFSYFIVFREDPAKPVVPRPVDHASNEEQVVD